jgi:hypothetical protein
MKIATIPSIRVQPAFRAEVEAVLAKGETLSQFVETALRAGVQRRRIDAEFVQRGLRARDQAQRSNDYVDAATVLDSLQRKLEMARQRMGQAGR